LEFVFLSKADLIAITETWLTPDDVAVRREVPPNGYKIIDFPRIDKRGGGLALLHKTGLVIDGVVNKTKLSFKCFEAIIRSGKFTMKLVTLYDPPFSDKHPRDNPRYF